LKYQCPGFNVITYELGRVANLYSVYVRGEAYLKLGDGQHATAEFQKIIEHRTVVTNSVLAALAYLQLGRAESLVGEKGLARNDTSTFLASGKTPTLTSPY